MTKSTANKNTTENLHAPFLAPFTAWKQLSENMNKQVEDYMSEFMQFEGQGLDYMKERSDEALTMFRNQIQWASNIAGDWQKLLLESRDQATKQFFGGNGKKGE